MQLGLTVTYTQNHSSVILLLFEAAPYDVEGVLSALDEFGEVRVPSKLLVTLVPRDPKVRDFFEGRFAFL